MIKKIAALAGAGAMLLAVAGPAFAVVPGFWGTGSKDVAIVNNGASAVASTGGNGQGNSATVKKAGVTGDVEVSGNNNMTTGEAQADATAVVVANTHIGCSTCGWSLGHKDVAVVNNGAQAGSLTGDNGQGNAATVKKAHVGGEVEVGGSNTLKTGPASSDADAWTVVNTHWNN